MFNLTKEELRLFKKLNTPIKIQDFLDSLPINFEKKGETNMSPRRVLQERKAHCMEGALLAAAILWFHGEDPLLMDLQAMPYDADHVVAIYKINGLWGAISKTNHATVRFRDPIYKTPRELAASYFHEYFLDSDRKTVKAGQKVLHSYSKPFNLKKFGHDWITSEDDLWDLAVELDESPHYSLYPAKNKKYIRKADAMERNAGKLIEWKE
jgi:hypothetical protein